MEYEYHLSDTNEVTNKSPTIGDYIEISKAKIAKFRRPWKRCGVSSFSSALLLGYFEEFERIRFFLQMAKLFGYNDLKNSQSRADRYFDFHLTLNLQTFLMVWSKRVK